MGAKVDHMQGVGEIENSKLRIELSGRNLTVDNQDDSPVRIFDIMGRQLASTHHSHLAFTLPAPGVYFIQSDGYPTRRIVAVQ